MPLRIQNLEYIRGKDAKLAEALQSIQNAINATAKKVGVDPTGQTPAPSAIQALNVTAANGMFSVAIVDNSPINKGINYFVEWDTASNFPTPHVIDLGASRTTHEALGNQTTYWRAFSQYADSPASPIIYCSANPVIGGGAAPPASAGTTGSGTAVSTGQQGGTGLGPVPFRPSPSLPGAPPTLGKIS